MFTFKIENLIALKFKGASRSNNFLSVEPRLSILFLKLRSVNYGFGSVKFTGYRINGPQGMTVVDVLRLRV